MQRRTASYKERCNNRDERDERGPERKHIQDRKRHIWRANLNRQKIISESPLRRRRQHKKHHDGAMHREQAQVSLRLDLPNQRQRNLRPDEVNPHQQR